MKQKIKKLTKIILVISLLMIPASCCEIYIRHETGDYPIIIDNVTNVGVCDINLTYDPDFINITEVIKRDFDYTDNIGNNLTGLTRIQAIQFDNPGLNGTVVIAEIELWINKSEEGVINISVNELAEATPDVKLIPYTVQNFSVSIPPSVTVYSPNGGEHWRAGTSHNIGWTATDNVGVTSIDIEYSTDGGETYRTIATSAPNEGVYHWTIPDTTSDVCRVKVIARDAAGNAGEDVSDGGFIIASATSDNSSSGGNGRGGNGGGLYPPTSALSPTSSASTAAPSAAPAPVEQEPPARATPTPTHLTVFHTEPSSLPTPILSPIAGIVVVVIAAIIGIVRVISITAQTRGETEPASEQTEQRKAIAAIIGIIIVAVAAIIGILLI